MDCRLRSCSRCKKEKSASDFYKDKQSKDGLAYHCKDCKKSRAQKYRNTEGYKQKVRRSKWKQQGIDVTYEQYLELFLKQNGKCAICGTAVNQFDKGMCVDHCHSTGKVRGLLCTKCNRGIGSLNDSKDLLQKAISYLEKYE